MNQLLHIDGITHLYHSGFRLFVLWHGNATYKRLNMKIIEDIDFKDRQFMGSISCGINNILVGSLVFGIFLKNERER